MKNLVRWGRRGVFLLFFISRISVSPSSYCVPIVASRKE